MQELEDYVVPHLNAQKPGVSVIHTGGSNINIKRINDTNVDNDYRIYNKYPVLCKFWQWIVYIINLIKSIGSNSVIRKINDELQELRKIYNFNYISTDEIGRSFLCDDGVHLSDNGMDILAGSFVNNTNSTKF